jgi:surface polysaccharide O-acyltransferase-like enzyme
LPHQLYIDFYRFAIGLVGGLVVILLWKCIIDVTKRGFGILSRLGSDSMGIYIISGYILVFAVQRLDFIEHQSYILNMIEAVLVLTLSYILVEILIKIPFIRKFVGK